MGIPRRQQYGSGVTLAARFLNAARSKVALRALRVVGFLRDFFLP